MGSLGRELLSWRMSYAAMLLTTCQWGLDVRCRSDPSKAKHTSWKSVSAWKPLSGTKRRDTPLVLLAERSFFFLPCALA